MLSNPREESPQLRRAPDGSGLRERRLGRVASSSVVGQTERQRLILRVSDKFSAGGVSGEVTRARVARARNRAPLAGGFDRDRPARRGRRGRCRAQLARHRTRHGRCAGERRAVPGLAPTHRRSHRLADPHDCADPHDLADPPKLAESLNSANPRDITDPENVTNPDPECQRPCRQSRHRHHGSPRPRRELLRQRGDHPAGGRDRGCSSTRVHRRCRHRVRATAADGDQCGGHRGWPSPGRSGRSHHQRGDAALGLTHSSRCSSVTA